MSHAGLPLIPPQLPPQQSVIQQPVKRLSVPTVVSKGGRVWLTVLALCGLLAVTRPLIFPTAKEALRAELAQVILDHQSRGLVAAETLLQLSPDDPYDVALASEIAALNSENALAMQRFERLPRDAGPWELQRSIGVARRLVVQGELSSAIVHLERAVEIAPTSLAARSELGHLLQLAGRNWEAASHFLAVVQQGKCRGDELLALAASESFFRSDERLELLWARSERLEPVMQLAQARRTAYDNDFEQAETLLRSVVQLQPQLAEAHGRLARILSERGDAPAFAAWWRQLPDEAKSHPEIWYAQGIQARRTGQLPAAMRCFWECVRLSPSHLAANLQMAACLMQTGQADVAKSFEVRAGLLSRLESILNQLRDSSDPELMRQTIALLADLGRWWEAAGWCYTLHATLPGEADLSLLKSMAYRASLHHTAQDPASNPALAWDGTQYPLPNWSSGLPSEQSTQSPSEPLMADMSAPAWQFDEVAPELGIEFNYVEGTSEANRLEHIVSVLGGGLGTFDYDSDGWPDLYVAQGNDWHQAGPTLISRQPQEIDRLYRNHFGQRFEEVTAPAGLGDPGFTHGVTVGDYNQDGFPDVYVSNLGANRLYQNNGDGTFADVTSLAGVAGADWSTSSVWADFSGDGLPDLYVANYAPVEETLNKHCLTAQGIEKACNPEELSAASDRFYQNRGDGTFADITASSGVQETTGRGLGLIAWDFAGTGQLSLFVGNDTSANFLWIPQERTSAGEQVFADEAVVRGVGLDREGNPIASMGIAAGDINGDGHIDLCVTNFFADGNVLFSQQPGQFFDDRTREFGVDGPSFWMLGFGNQYADFDGDSWLDMLVTNGHVDQVTSRGTPDRMPIQLFWSQRGKRFADVSADHLGEVFQRLRLGRGLAVWDWNRDGHLDAAISHLHDPLSVLKNQTPQGGEPLVVRLVGRTGTRDAVGATVHFKTSTRQQTRLVLAGDGYLVSNERLIHFTAAPGETVEITVQWPGGQTDRHADLAAGQEIVLVEGAPQPKTVRWWSAAAKNSAQLLVK